MRKVRVLQISVANSKSGLTQYVLNNWDYINKEKYQFDFVTFGSQLDFQDRLEREGCKVYFVKHRAEDNLESFRQEIRKIMKNGYDVVHLHTSYWKSFELEKLAKEEGIPRIIVHAHNSGVHDDSDREIKEEQHKKMLELLTPEIATDFFACSKTAAKWLYADRIPQDKIKIMKNAIDVGRFAFNAQVRAEYREKLGWDNCYILGHIGRFSYQKNHEFLIAVFRDLADKMSNAKLLLIGKGPKEGEIKKIVANYGLTDKVYFAGVREDANNWLQAMDCFCLPSRFEGLPIVAVEAQTAGLKCLCSDIISDEVKITYNIQLIPLNKSDWVNAILVQAADSHERRNMAEIVSAAGYDLKSQIRIIEEIYAYNNSDSDKANKEV